MKRTNRILTSPWAQWGAAILVLLAVVPRVVMLERRPLMHDESLFAYYAYSYLTSGQYIHIPMLHGPTLMLVAGKLFKTFGDTILVGRLFVALASLAGLVAGLWLWPRRYRFWLAPLLFTSPILLFYSRFFRDDMLMSACYLLGTLGFAHALSGRSRLRPLWAAVGAFFVIIPLAIMESALFFQAAGVTFGMVWLASRLLPGPWTWPLRPRPRTPLRVYQIPAPQRAAAAGKGSGRARRDATAAATLAPPPPLDADDPVSANEFEWPAAARRRLPWSPTMLALGWGAGILLGLAFVMYVYGITYDFSQYPAQYGLADTLKAKLLAPFLNMKASWVYWKGQHEQHRIDGPLHYHLPILLTYELPILLAIAVGLLRDASSRLRRALFYSAAVAGWLGLWALWRLVSYTHFGMFNPLLNPHTPPPMLVRATQFLHIQPDLSMLILGLMIAPLLAWSVLMLRERRVLGAWLGWWAACSLFQYSSAGEKVPWLALHIALPLYMAMGWIWAPWLRRMSHGGRTAAAALMAAASLFALRSDIHLITDRCADPHERVIYNHTPPEFDALCRSHVNVWQTLAQAGGTALDKRNVILVDAPGWPGVWYFRHCAYQLPATAPAQLAPDTDLVIGNKDLLAPLAAQLDRSQWKVIEFYPDGSAKPLSLRDHWMAPWPDKEVLPPGKSVPGALWDYYWNRKTWTEPGGFPLLAIEPVRLRN